MDSEYEYEQTLETVRRLKTIFYKTKDRYFTERKARLEELIAQVNTFQCAHIVKRVTDAEMLLKKHLSASHVRHRSASVALNHERDALLHLLRRQKENCIYEVFHQPKCLVKPSRLRIPLPMKELNKSNVQLSGQLCGPVKRKSLCQVSKRIAPNSMSSHPRKNRTSHPRKSELHNSQTNSGKEKRIHKVKTRSTRSTGQNNFNIPPEVACIVYRLQPSHIESDINALYSWTVSQDHLHNSDVVSTSSTKQKVPSTRNISNNLPHVGQGHILPHDSKRASTPCVPSRVPLPDNSLEVKRAVTNESSLSFFTQQRLKEKLLYQLHPDLQISSGCSGKFNKEFRLAQTLTKIGLPVQQPPRAVPI